MFDQLYDYQQEAVGSTKGTDKGTVVLPTGTGKTFCQAAIIAGDILERQTSEVYVVNSPRILLSFQLLKEVYSFLVKSGTDARYMFVHSGGSIGANEMEEIRTVANLESSGDKIKFSQIVSSTSSSEIEEMMEKAERQSLPLIIFSTYNSCPRVEIARANRDGSIRMLINDEAHYLTREEFHKILSTVTCEKTFNFTATAKYTPSSDGRGMNNEEKYGNIIYSMTPREAIDRGKMVRPRIHAFVSDSDNSFDDFQKSMSKIIFEAFRQHQAVISSLETNAKILVSAKGVGDIKKFLDSKEYTKLRKSGVDIFAVASSDQVGNRINSCKASRKEFLKKLKEYGENPEKKLIVLHYDILAEGIDVSGFTAILPLRTLQKSKFLQTYGRSARLHPEDREAFDSGKYSPADIGKLKKPFSYILIPNLADGNEDDYANIADIIYEMREFDFSCIENIISSEIKNGVIEIDEVDGLNDVDMKLKELGKLIASIESELEEAEMASMTKKGKMNRALFRLREKKGSREGKKRKFVKYKVFDCLSDAKNEGLTVCSKVSMNNVKDIAAMIENMATTSRMSQIFHVDKAGHYHPESWANLEKNHPEYIGKFLVPVFIWC